MARNLRKRTKKISESSDSDEEIVENVKNKSDGNKKCVDKVVKNEEDDGSSSDSSVENYLKPAHEIDLDSSFFTFEKVEDEVKKEEETKIGSLSSSDSDEDENLEVKEEVKIEKGFESLENYHKKIEEAKKAVESYKNKKKKEEKVDIKKLLSVGESQETQMESSYISGSSDDEMNWDEIEKQEAVSQATKEIPKEGVSITIEFQTKAPKKKQDDYLMQVRRRLNRVRKENQVLMHKVHLLCWIAHGNYVNSTLNSENLLAQCLSLIPNENCYPPQRADLKYLEQITKWYSKNIKLIEKVSDRVPTIALERILQVQITRKEASSKKYFVLIFIIILRALGLQCRLILSLRPLPLRPPQSELCSLSTKNNQSTSKSDVKETKTSTKEEGSSKAEDRPKVQRRTSTSKKSENDQKSDSLKVTKDTKPRSRSTTELSSKKAKEEEEGSSKKEQKPRSRSTVESSSKKESTKKEEEDSSKTEQKPRSRRTTKSDKEKAEADKSESKNAGGSPSKAKDIESSSKKEQKPRRSTKAANEGKLSTSDKSESKNARNSPSKTKEVEVGVSRSAAQTRSRRSVKPVDYKDPEDTPDKPEASSKNEKNSTGKNKDVAGPESKNSQEKASKSRAKDIEVVSKSAEQKPRSRRSVKPVDYKDPEDTPDRAKDKADSKKVDQPRSRRSTNVEEKSNAISAPKSRSSLKASQKETSKDDSKQSKSTSDSKKPPKSLNRSLDRSMDYSSEEEFRPDRRSNTSLNNSFSSSSKNDVRGDIMNILKGDMLLQKQTQRSKTVRKSTNYDDSDSDYMPEPEKKSRRSDSADEFQEKKKKNAKDVKVKQRVKPRSVLEKEKEIDRRVLSSDDEGKGKKEKEKVGNDVWCEVFLEAEEKWISVDVLKCQVHCVSELNSRASTPITYILAWNNNFSIKDVTSRYCPHMNTITRKLRVDTDWWNRSLKPFLGRKTARDKEEDEELARQQLEQPLPKTIAEYKNHPLYALKRHLLKFEAIYPPDAVTLGFVRNEPVYARECVHTLHSREIWIKHAKVVRPGEQPYKIVKARPKYDKLSGQMITDKPLEIFGPWQVDDYVPPNAENGVVPRNAFGNVELFKPCMLPGGTVHLQLPGLNKICRRLQIDCAPALVGFDYHSGGSHPLYDGYVVCAEFEDKLIKAWEEEQEEIERREREKIEKRVYDNWKKLIKGLLIREKLKDKYGFEGASGSGKSKKSSKGPRFVAKKRRVVSDSDSN